MDIIPLDFGQKKLNLNQSFSLPNKLQSESLCEVVGRRGEVQKDAKETPKTSDSAAIYQFTENNS